jgi:hypothetical protein
MNLKNGAVSAQGASNARLSSRTKRKRGDQGVDGCIIRSVAEQRQTVFAAPGCSSVLFDAVVGQPATWSAVSF